MCVCVFLFRVFWGVWCILPPTLVKQCLQYIWQMNSEFTSKLTGETFVLTVEIQFAMKTILSQIWACDMGCCVSWQFCPLMKNYYQALFGSCCLRTWHEYRWLCIYSACRSLADMEGYVNAHWNTLALSLLSSLNTSWWPGKMFSSWLLDFLYVASSVGICCCGWTAIQISLIVNDLIKLATSILNLLSNTKREWQCGNQ